MIVCQCHAVTDSQVRAVVAEGCTSVAAVARATGAGSFCGGCVATIRQLACGDCPMVAAPSAAMAALSTGGVQPEHAPARVSAVAS